MPSPYPPYPHQLRVLMPHSKKEGKMDRKSKIGETIPEICEMRNCNNCVFVEMRKKMDAYMWYGEVAGADATRSPQRAPLAVPHSPAPAVPHAIMPG